MNQIIANSVYRPASVKAAFVIVHGMCEHRKRYDRFAKKLEENGFGVVTFDLPGHGESVGENGTRGYFGDENGWGNLIESVHFMVEKCKKEFPGVPVILFGHSMGSMLCRCFLQKYDGEIDGVILSGAPNYQSAVPSGIVLGKIIRFLKGKKALSPLMTLMVTGQFNKVIKNPDTPFDWISYNKENIKNYMEDKDCGFAFTVQGYIDELGGLEQMHNSSLYRCTKPQLPIYFVAGVDDPCRGGEEGFNDSMNTLKSAGYTNVTSKLYDGMRHEILQEVEHDKVENDILAWLNENIL